MAGVRSILGVLLATVCLAGSVSAEDAYPERPVKLVVYTAPGGLLDVTLRKLGNVWEKKFPSHTVVIENKKGAGGLVALQHVLRQRADGHAILGVTSSLVSKAVSTKKDGELEKLTFLARLVDDYECIIVREDSKFSDLKSLVQAAKEKPGEQIWAGPAAGGTDHLFALRFWNAADISATWIPYRSGSEAIAAVLGGHAEVYVGNPQDVSGREGLKVLAVAEPEDVFPNIPSFEELGYPSLSGESLWRGVAVPASTPPEVKERIVTILREVTEDPEWRQFIEKGNALPVFDLEEKFTPMVAAQRENDREILKELSSIG